MRRHKDDVKRKKEDNIRIAIAKELKFAIVNQLSQSQELLAHLREEQVSIPGKPDDNETWILTDVSNNYFTIGPNSLIGLIHLVPDSKREFEINYAEYTFNKFRAYGSANSSEMTRLNEDAKGKIKKITGSYKYNEDGELILNINKFNVMEEFEYKNPLNPNNQAKFLDL